MWNSTAYNWLQMLLGFTLLQSIACECFLPELDFPNGEIKFPPLTADGNLRVAKELSVLKFSCSKGYLRVGPEYIQCVDGNWPISHPFCANMRCPYPPLIENATYIVTSGPNNVHMVGSSTVYLCNADHEFKHLNETALRCDLDVTSRTAEWTGETPVCREKSSCPEPGVSLHGRKWGKCCMSGDVVSYSCQPGFELVGEQQIRCLPTGTWSSLRPRCKRKAKIAGDPKSVADKLKKEGVEIFCIGITHDMKKKVLSDIASSSKYGRYEEVPNGFILQDYDTLAWLVQQISNGTVDYSKCGLGLEKIGRKRGRIVGGQSAKDPWPWMAALYMTTGNEIPPRRELRCGGSIIHTNFILTAAHCMFHNTEKRDKTEIRVKLGLTDLHNETFLQEFEVRKIHLHPNYHHTNTYDYDIALLQLKNPIRFERLVRPICLPPEVLDEDSQLYKPQTLSWAAGWGHVRTNSKTGIEVPIISPFLKEIGLPHMTREKCMQSIKDDGLTDAYFTDRMFCVGVGGGRNDTCAGDSGGPLIQSELNAEGYHSWTQVGIISWGLGCGLKHEYGFNTHLQKLRPWVDDTIDTAMKSID